MKLRERLFRLLFGAEYAALAAQTARIKELAEEKKILREEIAKLEENEKEILATVSRQNARLREQLELEEALRTQVQKLTPRRPRFDRPVEMDEQALGEVLAGTATAPIMKAVMQLLDEKFMAASDSSIGPKLTEGEMKFGLGGADWLAQLKADLQAYTERGKE